MDPSILNAVLSKALQAQRAADAAKKARELVRRKSVLSKSTLPGKLADCTSTDLAQSEIFLVEGDSAGAIPGSLHARSCMQPCSGSAGVGLPFDDESSCQGNRDTIRAAACALLLGSPLTAVLCWQAAAPKWRGTGSFRLSYRCVAKF